MLKFSNPDTAAKYESDFVKDPVVHIPGVRMGNGWKDNLSKISPENAERLIAQKSNLVREKATLRQAQGDKTPLKKIESPRLSDRLGETKSEEKD